MAESESTTSEIYSETTNAIARRARVPPDAVRHYTDLGLIEHVRLPNGVRLLKPSAADSVRAVYAQHIANKATLVGAVMHGPPRSSHEPRQPARHLGQATREGDRGGLFRRKTRGALISVLCRRRE